ncbi:MAG: putative sulfate exporter family transporter [Planctomycetales bacterium]|nr:putative sulfate exporter family transporter [Planctomycetales bacterium]
MGFGQSTVSVEAEATGSPISTTVYSNPLSSWIGKPGKWTLSVLDSLAPLDKETGTRSPETLIKIASTFVLLTLLLAGAATLRDGSRRLLPFVGGFAVVFLLALVAYTLAAQSAIKSYNLEFALWALLIGLIVSNTVGTPKFLRDAARTEFYIKAGLVLLGAEVLLPRLLELGVPGVFVAWVVTPIVLISTYIFGQRVLKIESRSLNMVISADMSVCGVSAAIATAASCRAKKEELSLAIGISLSFTVIMMVVLPAVISFVGMDPIIGGAWIGGTVDSTGAVAAAGASLGDEAVDVATTVKMIQNILIGVTSFLVAVYWVTYVERDPQGQRPHASEIWKRFPKFVVGFLLVSVLFSVIHAGLEQGPDVVDAVSKGLSKEVRGWLFCLAFVSIGLETRFADFAKYLRGGKPLILYLCGQTLNLILTLLMAWIMFGWLFPPARS